MGRVWWPAAVGDKMESSVKEGAAIRLLATDARHGQLHDEQTGGGVGGLDGAVFGALCWC